VCLLHHVCCICLQQLIFSHKIVSLCHFQSAGKSIGLFAHYSGDQCVITDTEMGNPYGWLQTWSRICASEFQSRGREIYNLDFFFFSGQNSQHHFFTPLQPNYIQSYRSSIRCCSCLDDLGGVLLRNLLLVSLQISLFEWSGNLSGFHFCSL